ncbi:MAG: hypothetical protein AAGJ81_05835 [Verrucomicrobiota bacterium]
MGDNEVVSSYPTPGKKGSVAFGSRDLVAHPDDWPYQGELNQLSFSWTHLWRDIVSMSENRLDGTDIEDDVPP